MGRLQLCRWLGGCLMAFVGCGMVWASLALGATAGAGWNLESFAAPSNFTVAQNTECPATLTQQFPVCDAYLVTARNEGSLASAEEAEILLSDQLPAGLNVVGHRVIWPHLAKELGAEEEENIFSFVGSCSGAPTRCSVSLAHAREIGFCSGTACSVLPGEEIRLELFVTIKEPEQPHELSNVAKVEGGGAPAQEVVETNRIGGAADFGLSHFDFYTAGLDGARDTQAADHPYDLTTAIDLNTKFRTGPAGVFEAASVEDVRDVVTNLPVGFVGSILAAPQCTFSQLSSHIEAGRGGCPKDTIVGHIRTEPAYIASINGPIYNMTPEEGFPAEFAYVDNLAGTHVFYTRVVPTPKGYVLQADNPEVPAVRLRRIVVSFYGVPAERDETSNLAIPFFTNPTDCAGEEPTASIFMDSWQHPARFNADGTPVDLGEAAWAKAESRSPAVTGCNSLRFPAEVKAQPTSHEADKPSGMDFEVKVPQSETVGVPATPTLKKVVVTLPAGLTVDPSAGDGLGACSEEQIGWLGGSHLNFDAAPPACPEASKIGSLELETPLIGRKLEGEMFLASQNANPFGATLAAYVVVHDPITGVLVKIAGEFLADPHSGQLTAVFDENPNLPFSDLKLHFFGGPRAELATPESCGTFTTTTQLSPWSFPDSGAPTEAFDDFVVDEACPGGFAPSFTAGSENLQAGGYTPFVASFQRSDTDQELSGLSVTLPPGLLAKVAGVPECPEADIKLAEESRGGCPEASQVGTVQTGVGPGPDPLFVSGKAYWTGPYKNGPYGVAVVVPAVAGPYDFGTVVVRQAVHIDPRTAQVTDTSDPFPTIIDGIPLRLRRVDLTLDRPEFVFNPTNCGQQGFTGTIMGSPLGSPTSLDEATQIGFPVQNGASKAFSTPFEVTNCSTLAFTPSVTVATKAQASKQNGANLTFKISYPKNAMGKQTWFQEAKFDLPKQLPARLETLQKACLAAVFEANPSDCPSAAKIGTAIVHTPVLPDPLAGPVYFVSYGDQKFPEAVLVLKGDNITFDLHGETFIDHKTGITSATFRNTPDVPFESIEVTIPEGRYSEFGANLPNKRHYNFCGQTLNMPTLFKAQNGQQINQTTHITITGCKPKRKQSKHTKKRKRG